MFNPQKILVLAPHTDDGELGCGGTISKLCREKKEVHYAAFSICAQSLPPGLPADTLEKECKEAVRVLGMDPGKLRFYDFQVRLFQQRRQEILEEMVSLNKYIQPELVFIPASVDHHQDHQVIHQEAVRAFRNSSVLGYELPWNHRSFITSYFMTLHAEDIDRKVKSLQEYKSQALRPYMQEGFIRGLSVVRGVQCNVAHAEAFEVYKIIS